MNKKEIIVIFDFDGTITKTDTMLDLARWHFGYFRFYFGLLRILPQLLLYKIGLISNLKAKESFLHYFYQGVDYEYFKNICKKYSLQMIDHIVKPEAKIKIESYKKRGHKMIIVTASIINWIEHWAIKNDFDDILASEVEVKNGKLTGKIEGKNCYGIEKLNSFIKKYGPIENYYTIGFGDSPADKIILAKMNESYYKKYE